MWTGFEKPPLQLYRRTGPDVLPDGSPHPAPWARLDRQFLIKLQGEDRPARKASPDEITSVEEFRQRYKKRVEESGGKLTITGILVKIVAVALQEFPQFNSSADVRNRQIIRKSYISIGVAVDTENGLLVPVIRDADQKSIAQISIEMTKLSEKARNKKLALEDMQGGTFTISNLGGIGGTNFTPIVNWPEVAILGVARSSYEPVHIDGQFQPRMIMPYALSYDHRVIDGADGARFTRFIDEALQNPMLLTLEG